jgi:phage recombination protein Bet
MAETETKERKPTQAVTVIEPMRLPLLPEIREDFGYDETRWMTLIDTCYPAATDINSILMALRYCKTQNVDPLIKAVHIVPIWSKQKGRLVDTVWPGIALFRIWAHRTKDYAGLDRAVRGPLITRTFENEYRGEITRAGVTFHEWSAVTVYRMVQGVRCAFEGPEVYWEEAYATENKFSEVPNEMWRERSRGQLDKCAEAAALRLAFPEQFGGEYVYEEAHRVTIGDDGARTLTPRQDGDVSRDKPARTDNRDKAAASSQARKAERSAKAKTDKPKSELKVEDIDPETGEVLDAEAKKKAEAAKRWHDAADKIITVFDKAADVDALQAAQEKEGSALEAMTKWAPAERDRVRDAFAARVKTLQGGGAEKTADPPTGAGASGTDATPAEDLGEFDDEGEPGANG